MHQPQQPRSVKFPVAGASYSGRETGCSMHLHPVVALQKTALLHVWRAVRPRVQHRVANHAPRHMHRYELRWERQLLAQLHVRQRVAPRGVVAVPADRRTVDERAVDLARAVTVCGTAQRGAGQAFPFLSLFFTVFHYLALSASVR
jgi:hypothetical protein